MESSNSAGMTRNARRRIRARRRAIRARGRLNMYNHLHECKQNHFVCNHTETIGEDFMRVEGTPLSNYFYDTITDVAQNGQIHRIFDSRILSAMYEHSQTWENPLNRNPWPLNDIIALKLILRKAPYCTRSEESEASRQEVNLKYGHLKKNLSSNDIYKTFLSSIIKDESRSFTIRLYLFSR